MTLAHDTAQPLYLQIKGLLLAEIDAGRLQAHQRLPSERELSAVHGVSRMTVRQALIDLQRMGAVYARVGKGTFVAPPKIDQQLRAVTSFTHEMRVRGATPSSQVLDAASRPATGDIAAALDVRPGDAVVTLFRLRLADGQPLALETAYLPASIVPGLLAHDFARESLYEVLATEYRLVLLAANQTIEAALADDDERRLLALDEPAAVLRMRRLSRSSAGDAVELVISTYRGDRYKLYSSLEPDGSANG